MKPFGEPSKRKPSHRTVKRSLRRPFGRLALDTSFARHEGQPPQQITYPYETRTQELTFIAFDDVKADLRPVFDVGTKPEEPLQPGPKRSAKIIQNSPDIDVGTNESRQIHSYAAALCETTPMLGQVPLQGAQYPRPNRTQKIRPPPLDLSMDGYPSYQTNPTGIAVTSRFSADTKSPTTAGTRYLSGFYNHERDYPTPAIVITPAREDFETISRDGLFSGRLNPRPTSSVYSRYTNMMPRSAVGGSTPPVPPLPAFISPTTASPRRSKGWWNVITSPFSARSGISFWRSPSIREEDPERMPILEAVSEMGSTNPHAGVIFTNRSPDDDELRSAPPTAPHVLASIDGITAPQRSSSAPGILGQDMPDFNIYNIPIHGEAASYFNPHKNFPSMMLSPAALAESPRDMLEGWSPSQSVAYPDRDLVVTPDDADIGDHHRIDSDPSVSKNSGRSDDISSLPKTGSIGVPSGPIQTDRGIFSSPAEHELRTVEIVQNQPTRSFTHVTNDTLMSPLSATPVVGKANVATRFGPESSFGEQREVEVAQARTSNTVLPERMLGASAMNHDADSQNRAENTVATEHSKSIAQHHNRQDSYGLGISSTKTDRTASTPPPVAARTPPELPPPPVLTEKSALVVDRFGQMQVRSLEEGNVGPVVSWYRRYLWVLISSAAALTMLLIVLLVLLVPQAHEDIPVEAQWLRLSGFPAMPTGVSTVIQPHTTKSRNDCVAPPSLWNCAAPVEQQIGQPNFRFEIRFRNGTVSRNDTIPITSQTVLGKRDRQSRGFRARRSTWTDYLFSSRPSPASKGDQEFLGSTTDNVSTPYNGEETPFWISTLDAVTLEPAMLSAHKRDNSNFTYPYPVPSHHDSSKAASTKAPSSIPKPHTQTSGKPVEQLLYPLVSAQPLRLFDRGQDTEHYGFYTYFDRTIYVSINSTGSGSGTNTTVSNVPLANASAVCTWSQTRLLVQIWTRKHNVNTTSLPNKDNTTQIPAGNSTANDMQYPGSLPYPVTITTDRHGGDAADKGVYCYGIAKTSHTVVEGIKTWVTENRGIGGTLVHPATVPGSNATASGMKRRDDGNATAPTGGVDGGSGGCLCQWQNWN